MDTEVFAAFAAQVGQQNEQNSQLLQVLQEHLSARTGNNRRTNEFHIQQGLPQGWLSTAIPRYLDRPPTFDGVDRTACEPFLAQCKQYISACPPALFATDAHKVDLVVSYLKGTAFTWVQPHLEKRQDPVEQHEMFRSFATFCSYVLTHQGSPT